RSPPRRGARAPRRVRLLRRSPAPQPELALHARQDPGSARWIAARMRLRPRRRRGLVPARPTAPVRRPPLRPVPPPPERGATLADPDRFGGLSPRPARDELPGGLRAPPPGRPPNARAGDGTAPACRARSIRPPRREP